MIKSLSSFFELNQDRCHVIPSIRIISVIPVVQILVEKRLKTLTTVATLQALNELFGQFLHLISVLFPYPVTPEEKQLFLSGSGSFDDVRHAGDRLLIEG